MNRGVLEGTHRLWFPETYGGGDPTNDGQLLVLDSTSPGGIRRAGSLFQILSHAISSDSFTTSSLTFVAVGSGFSGGANASMLDMTLYNVRVNSVLEYSISGLWGNNAQAANLDIACVPNGSLGNRWNTANGNVGWRYPGSIPSGTPANVGFFPITGSSFHVVTSGDLNSDSSITVRPMFFVATTGSATIFGDVNNQLNLVVKNLGTK